jgi:outer membrane receptor protein involved in Fe transport
VAFGKVAPGWSVLVARLWLALGLALLSIAAMAAAAPAWAQGAAPPVIGTVAAPGGVPLANVSITIRGEGTSKTVRSDAQGRFDFGRLAAGTYEIEAQAKGYEALRERTIAVRAEQINRIALTLERSQASSLLVIGKVTVNGTPAISTAPVPSVNIDAQQYAAQAVTRVSDILTDQLSTTVYPILGGGLNAPAVVALRGPDPSETLVDVDGHQVNNGSTGDFDLSLLDPADLENVQVVYGIAPSALYGPNTLGGALNVVTLEPSTVPSSLMRFSIGSYDTLAETVQATGTDERWGYAFSVHLLTSGGQLDNYAFPNTTDPDTLTSTGTSPIGNDMSALSDIAKIRYTFGNGGYIGLSFYDQAVYRDLSATLSSEWLPQNGSPGGVTNYSNFSGSSVSSNDDAYGLDLSLPLGPLNADGTAGTTMLFRHQTSLVSQTVNGAAAGSSPYLYNNRDLIADDTLEVDRQLPHAELSFKGAITNEDLVTDNVLGVIYADALRTGGPISPDDSVTQNDPDATVQYLGQTQRWLGARYTDDPTSKLHYSFATYYSDYSTFGHSVDPRFGFVWTPTAASALRASVGSTFQSPQLPTFIVPAPNTPIPVVDGYASIGNPDATAERSTEYDLGYEHLLTILRLPTHLGLDIYRTDLHNGVADYYGPKPCQSQYVELQDDPTCLTYPVNVTREVYEGIEVRGGVALARDTTLGADYDVDSVYTQSVPADALDGVVPFEQALGVPLHKFVVDLEHMPNLGFTWYAGLLHEGAYNELNLPPFTTLRAGIGWRTRDYEVTLAGENLTNTYNFLFTQEQGGVPYGAVPQPILPSAYPLPGRRITLILTRRT